MSDHTPETEPDVQSDPSLDDTEGTEWADEGGATTEGPATDTDNDDTNDTGDTSDTDGS